MIYTDEAGTSAKEPVCVVAAIIVHGDNQWKNLEAEINRVIDKHVPPSIRPGFVIHATEIFSGGKRVKRDEWPLDERLDFLKEILNLTFIYDVPIAVGVEFKRDWSSEIDLSVLRLTPNSKPLDSNKFCHLLAFNKCMERADLFLRKYLNGSEIGTVVAEDVPEMKTFLSLGGLLHRHVEGHLTLPSDMMKPSLRDLELGLQPTPCTYRIDHIVDVPHFVQKGRAPLLQLADACAFALRHCITRKDHGDELIYAMLGHFDSDNFLNDANWFAGSGSGLFNTLAYWSDDQKKQALEEQAMIAFRT